MSGVNAGLLRLTRSTLASAALVAIVAALAMAYTSGGGASRDSLIAEMLSNFILVLGMQVFIGNTGVLSFGHMAFAQIAAYATAVVGIPLAAKAKALPDIPFGLDSVHYGPLGATVFAIVVTIIIGGIFGIAVSRASGLAPTMITLAALFVVEQLVKNWKELTRGAGGLSGIPRLEGNGWLWVGAFVALVVAHLFQETRIGRFAIATREDELAAPALGIRLFSARWAAWVVSMGLIALGGSLRAQSLGSVNPKQFTLDSGILILVMLVVGGMRCVSGAVLGTVLITAGNELFRQLGDPQRLDIERFPDLFLGGTMLLVMLLRPGGLLGDRDLAGWLRRRTYRRPPPTGEEPRAGSNTLVAAEIEVHFGGFVALDGAGVTVRPGEVVGLIGPNGAGKTTLFNVITGIVHEQGGRVTLGDRELTDAKPVDIARAGLARTFQNLRLFKNLSVRENVALTELVAARHRSHRVRPDADTLLADAGLTEWADRQAGTLDYGNQRRLELARAAALAPDFLLLDEPTSGMSDQESQAMVESVRSVATRVGAGVLVIDHDLGFITRISDHIVVLNEGRILAEGTPAAVRANPLVAEAYLGSSA
ncbi:MAG: ATP-binding cassette domain-containing protein [Ilumatobacteraceae bacterium]|mgnify:FL=1|nr:ATP-binding cassette domain-containing protein [Ilumatobacteraceae bacterium]MBP9053421.1 ATP-binding cassette domain-containing protein [Ilumatobacteraceae bacterium]